MTPEQQIAQLKAENARLREMNETQDATIRRLWVANQKKTRRCEIQQWIIDKAEQDQPPTWKERIMQQANEVFKDG
jgi:hypothetical protein